MQGVWGPGLTTPKSPLKLRHRQLNFEYPKPFLWFWFYLASCGYCEHLLSFRSNVKWVWFNKISVWYQTTQHTATKHKHSTRAAHYKQKHCKRDDKQLMWDLLQALNQKDEIHLIHHNITIDSVKLRAPELETGLYHQGLTVFSYIPVHVPFFHMMQHFCQLLCESSLL